MPAERARRSRYRGASPWMQAISGASGAPGRLCAFRAGLEQPVDRVTNWTPKHVRLGRKRTHAEFASTSAEWGGRETGKTVPSGSFRANAFGLYDTAGNAAEWVEDCWNPNVQGRTHRRLGLDEWRDCSLHGLRGGSFADKALAVRSSARFRYDEGIRCYANGSGWRAT